MPVTKEDMRVKLAESGLTELDAQRLRLRFLKPEQTERLGAGFKRLSGIEIPYFNLAGQVVDFSRVRYLERPSGFGGMVKRWGKYAQERDTPPEVYLPPLAELSWGEIGANPGIAVHVTEGEFKAAAATKVGFPTIGLGGVHAWKSNRLGWGFHPTLEQLRWDGRVVYLAFDSDLQTNPAVQRALRMLCNELVARGAEPCIVRLPTLEGQDKTGLDDFLQRAGVVGYSGLLSDAEPYEAASALWALNAEVAYVRDPGLVLRLETGQRMSASAFKEHAYSNRYIYEQSLDQHGTPKVSKKLLAPKWLKWEQRHELAGFTYLPGEERIVDGYYNFWRGWGCEPKRGSIKPWRELLDHLFGHEVESRRWFERWCAIQFQRPGTKIFSAVLLWGARHGTGKSLLGETLKCLFGESNVAEVSQADLHGDFNDWLENKQLVISAEVSTADHAQRKLDSELLKDLITRERWRINAKYVAHYYAITKANFFLTANGPQAWALDDDDRRAFVHEVTVGPKGGDFYHRYIQWMHGAGPSALFYHFLKLDLGNFDPAAHAPMTPAKQEMIYLAKGEIGAWVHRLREYPDEMLKLGKIKLKGDLFTAAQLANMCQEAGHKVGAQGMGRQLKVGGFALAAQGKPVRIGDETLRLYAIRNRERWERATPQEVAEHYRRARSASEDDKSKKSNKF